MTHFFHTLFSHPFRLFFAGLGVAILAMLFWPHGTAGFSQNALAVRSAGGEVAMDFAESAPMMKFVAAAERGGIAPPMPVADGFDPEAAEAKIIRNANLSLEVNDVGIAVMVADSAIKKLGGAIESSSISRRYDDAKIADLSARVPAEKLDEALAAFAALGETVSRSVSARDVTAAYTDRKVRLKNLRAREETLRGFFDRAEKVKDLVEVERELSRVRSEIESLERSQTRTDRDVAWSQIWAHFEPKPKAQNLENDGWTFARVWTEAKNDLAATLRGAIGGAVRVVVFSVIWLPIVAIGWAVVRRRDGKKSEKK